MNAARRTLEVVYTKLRRPRRLMIRLWLLVGCPEEGAPCDELCGVASENNTMLRAVAAVQAVTVCPLFRKYSSKGKIKLSGCAAACVVKAFCLCRSGKLWHVCYLLWMIPPQYCPLRGPSD